ncbi:unknown [Clostridium sp. CAG:921]|nr:unknown [Clostridium sp. CAG:921]
MKNENNQVNDQSATRQDYVANNVNSNIDNGSNQVVNGQNYGNTNFNPVGYNQANYTKENFNAQNTYNSSVNDSDSKVCVILSIAIPIVMFILKWFVGTSLYIDIIVATVGLTLAKKGESSSKPLAILGMILNIIFILLVVIFFLLTLYVVTCVD